MTQDDEVWRRPGSRPPTPHRGLIDPAEHAPPVVPEPDPPHAPAETGEPSPQPGDVSAYDDRIDVGRPERPGTSRRRRLAHRLVAVLVVLALAAGGAAGALTLLDERRAVTQDDLATAITTFRPSDRSETDVQSAEELRADGDYLPEPKECAGLVLVTPDGAMGGASWFGSPDGSDASINLRAVRFADPAAARTVLADLRSAVPRCGTIAFAPASTGGVTFALTPVGRTGRLAPRDRLSYLLTDQRAAPTSDPAPGSTTDPSDPSAPDTADPDRTDETTGAEPDFEVHVRRTGNVVIWGLGPQGDTAKTSDAVDDLTRRLRVLAAG